MSKTITIFLYQEIQRLGPEVHRLFLKEGEGLGIADQLGETEEETQRFLAGLTWADEPLQFFSMGGKTVPIRFWYLPETTKRMLATLQSSVSKKVASLIDDTKTIVELTFQDDELEVMFIAESLALPFGYVLDSEGVMTCFDERRWLPILD